MTTRAAHLRRLFLTSCASLALSATITVDSAFADGETHSYSIPSEDLGTALRDFGVKSGKDVVFDAAVVQGRKSSKIEAKLSDEEALGQLLADSGLKFSKTQSGSFVIGAGGSKNAQAASNEAAESGLAVGRATENSSDPADVRMIGKKKERTTAADQDKPLSVAPEEVEVTGTRLLDAPVQGAVEQRSYGREVIEKSGQPNLISFLQTLPEVSQSTFPSGLNASLGGETNIQLRGFPVGTTLVLIDGHHAPNSPFGTGAAFDVNNIPDALLGRIDILPLGSSAIYGSDALAGTVNFVLRRDLNGFEASASRGSASHYEEYRTSVSFGHQFDNGDIGIGLSYEENGPLAVGSRAAIAGSDFSRFASLGGTDTRQSYYCTPGSVTSTTATNLPGLSSPVAAINPGITGRPSLSDFQSGVTPRCGLDSTDLLGGSSRLSALGYADWDITDGIKAYATILFGHRRESANATAVVTGRLVPASNPYNPFGVPVTVASTYIPSPSEQVTYTDFLHFNAGLTGKIFSTWNWDLSGVVTQDHDSDTKSNNIITNLLNTSLASTDPATAFNPFGTTIQGTAAQSFLRTTDVGLHDRSIIGEFVMRGPLLDLPAGPVQAAFGVQYENQNYRNMSESFATTGAPVTSFVLGQRDVMSAFGEVRIPVVPALGKDEQPMVVISAAGRWDHFSDFGDTANPQLGLEVRPAHPLLLRASYSEAFRAPTLNSLYSAQTTLQVSVVDPSKNNATVVIPVTGGGNPNLKPETGESYSFGAVWSDSEDTGNLTASATWWHLSESNRVTSLTTQVILSNPALFQDYIHRDASGNLVSLSSQFLNFGDLAAEGVDVDMTYPLDTSYGTFTPRLSATVTTKFDAAILPGQPMVNRLDAATFTDVWAPGWKANLGIDWAKDAFGASLSGRYLGQYQDYQTPANNNHLGNYWLWDANVSAKIGQFLGQDEPLVRNTTLSVSGVNIFNRGPRYSNYYYGFYGYDAAEYDILGRFVSIKLGTSW